MITKVSIEPTEEPVTVAEVKAHCGIAHDSDDTLIDRLIETARSEAEHILRGSVMPQTVTGYLDAFSDEMPLPFPPLRSVESITYIDEDGSEQTLDSSVYTVDLTLPRVLLGYNQSWPDVRNQKNAVTIVFNTGYASADALPAKIKSAILLMVAEMYENREEESIGITKSKNAITAERLLWPLRDLR